MFGISFYELLVILVVIVILLKPKEIGFYLYNLGKIVKKTKTFIFKVQNQIEDIATLGNISDYEIKDKNDIITSNSKKTNSLNNNKHQNQKSNTFDK